MSKQEADAATRHPDVVTFANSWDNFWFAPKPIDAIARIRGVLCLLTVAYFVSSFFDTAFWYGEGGPLSATQVATFLATSGLEDSARWIISPLFLTSALWVYYVYLLIGIALAVVVACGRGSRIAAWLLWVVFVGWANRAMFVSGLAESLLSLSLFAVATASPAGLRSATAQCDWTSRFAQRLLSVQGSLILLATFLTMLGGRVWFNGFGAIALAAPVQDRTFDLATSGLLRNPLIYETLTHLMVLALPVGLFLAWMRRTSKVGKIILWCWCGVVAVIGSMWLYAATLACMVAAIDRTGD